MSQYSALLDSSGNFTMAAGMVVCLGATTTYFEVGGGSNSINSGVSGDQSTKRSISAGDSFHGGSGRNYIVSGGPVNPDIATGFYLPAVPDRWVGPAAWWIERDSGTGDLSVHDGVDVLAVAPAFSSTLAGVASAGTFPSQSYAWDEMLNRFVGVTDPDFVFVWSLVWELYGPGGFPVAYLDSADPVGVYTTTTYGRDAYNAGNPWTYAVTGSSAATTATATTYGKDTYNGGAAFSLDINPESLMPSWPSARAKFAPFSGTAQAGDYLPTGWQSWVSAVDSNWTITVDSLGVGEMSDGTDVVATRPADASRLYDPGGTWAATAYGEASYGAGEFWAGDVIRQFTSPGIAGCLYVILRLDGSNEVTGVDGPHFSAALPPNSSTEKVFIIAVSDGLGGVRQIQEGPIVWVP